jgi:uracil-DNA glycosylase
MDPHSLEQHSFPSLNVLKDQLIRCRLCPRLVAFRETVPSQPAYRNQIHWRKPVPGFGDDHAWLMLLGLAPAASGGNRTGRPFTGDKSGDFLVNALYETGLANQPESIDKEDGLKLLGCYMAAAVKCVPPQNKPRRQEFLNCSQYYQAEFQLLKKLKVVLALGKFAFDAFLFYARTRGYAAKGLVFKHGASYRLSEDLPILYASYHPSPRNTNTGTLNKEMMISLLEEIKKKHQTNT